MIIYLNMLYLLKYQILINYEFIYPNKNSGPKE